MDHLDRHLLTDFIIYLVSLSKVRYLDADINIIVGYLSADFYPGLWKGFYNFHRYLQKLSIVDKERIL